MSVVISAGTHDFVIMISDGRVSHINEAGEFSILREDFPKIKLINSKLCVGFTGDFEMALTVLTALNNLPQEELNTWSFDQAFSKIVDMMKFMKQKNEHMPKSSMVLSGVHNGNMEIRYTQSSDFVSVKERPNENLSYVILTSKEAPDIDFVKCFTKSTTLLEAMRNYVKELAAKDNTVNTNLYELMIKNN